MCCGKCSDRSSWNDEEVCFCRTQHSTASSTCTCWSMPSLLRVSRTMRHHAMSVFYSKNHFVVLPSRSSRCPQSYGILQFLQSIPLASRHHLRHITWILPPLVDDFLLYSDLPYKDWSEFIDICRQEIVLSSLTIHIDLSLSASMEDQGMVILDDDDTQKLIRQEFRIASYLAGMYIRSETLCFLLR